MHRAVLPPGQKKTIWFQILAVRKTRDPRLGKMPCYLDFKIESTSKTYLMEEWKNCLRVEGWDSPPNCFFQLQGILHLWVFMVCLHSAPVRVPSRVPSPQSPLVGTHTLHCHSPQSDFFTFFSEGEEGKWSTSRKLFNSWIKPSSFLSSWTAWSVILPLSSVSRKEEELAKC